MIDPRRFKVNSNPDGTYKVLLGETDISNALIGVGYQIAVNHPPRVRLELNLWDVSSDLESARFVVPPAVRELLVQLGWTPPAEEAS